MPQQMLKSRRAWAAMLAIGLAVLAWWGLAGGGRLDRRTRAILEGATRVEVFRLDGKNGPQPAAEGEERIGGFLVTARGKDQGKEFAGELADILADEKTYSRGGEACFWPGVAFRVWKGEECVEVLVCFLCDNFYCGPPAPGEGVKGSFHGTPARARLVRLAQEAFPEDKEIQGLKAE
jgi:hypothetical protein